MLHLAQVDTLPVNHTVIQSKTRKDPVLSKVHEMVVIGWPENSPVVHFDSFFHRTSRNLAVGNERYHILSISQEVTDKTS